MKRKRQGNKRCILEEMVNSEPSGRAAERSKARVCGCLLAVTAASNTAGDTSVSRESCVLSSRGLCDELITRPEESNHCDVSLYVIEKPQWWGGPGPRWTLALEERNGWLRILRVKGKQSWFFFCVPYCGLRQALWRKPTNAPVIVYVVYWPHLHVSVACCDHAQGV